MKKKLTITFEIDDQWFCDETNEYKKSDDKDMLTYAVNLVTSMVEIAPDEFLKAELDGSLLFDRYGEASEEVKNMARFDWIIANFKGFSEEQTAEVVQMFSSILERSGKEFTDELKQQVRELAGDPEAMKEFLHSLLLGEN